MSRTSLPPARMDPALKAQWLTDLRSGGFKQGQNFLRSIKNEYCCLGVLCEALSLQWHIEPEDDEDTFPMTEYFVYDSTPDDRGHSDFIPPAIASSIGLPPQIAKHLAEMNDNGDTFAEIANWIEENL